VTIIFYVNRCGFHIVEYFNSHHPDANDSESADEKSGGMFRFQKRIRNLRLVVFQILPRRMGKNVFLPP